MGIFLKTPSHNGIMQHIFMSLKKKLIHKT
jgi:hypothetical protein